MSESATLLPEDDVHPTDVLIKAVVNALVPLFADADPKLAYLAALRAVMAYDVRDAADLIAVGELVALSLSTVVTLGQAAAAESASLALRLRSNANAMIRSQERIRRQRADRAAQQVRSAWQTAMREADIWPPEEIPLTAEAPPDQAVEAPGAETAAAPIGTETAPPVVEAANVLPLPPLRPRTTLRETLNMTTSHLPAIEGLPEVGAWLKTQTQGLAASSASG